MGNGHAAMWLAGMIGIVVAGFGQRPICHLSVESPETSPMEFLASRFDKACYTGVKASRLRLPLSFPCYIPMLTLSCS